MTKPHLILMRGTDLVDSKGTINEEALDTFMAAIDNAFGIETQEHLAGKHDQKSHGRRGGGGGGGGGTDLGSDKFIRQMDVSINEQVALMNYKLGGFRAVNDHLRTGTQYGTGDASQFATQKQVDRDIAGLDSTLARSKLSNDTVLYRGGNRIGLDVEGLEPGMVYSDKGFLSTTRDPDLAHDWARVVNGSNAVVFEILTSKGQRGVSLKAHRDDNEEEVLLPRNQKFVIKDKLIERGRIPIILMEAINE